MALRTRLDSFDLTRDVMAVAGLSPQGQAKVFQQAAREIIAGVDQRNAQALGHVPPKTVTVDQSRGASIKSAKADSTIYVEYDLVETALGFIGELLVRHSPVRSGRFQQSWMLFADGVAVEPGKVPSGAEEYAFLNAQPYSRKIERGLSPQAPEGVADAVAALAKRRWGNIANIRFSFRSFPSGAVGAWAQTGSARSMAKTIRKGNEAAHHEWLTRQPAVIVTPFSGRGR